MRSSELRSASRDLARVAVAGEPAALGHRDGRLVRALGAIVDVRRIDTAGGIVRWPRALRALSRRVARDGAELVHLFDASLAPAALLVRRRFGVPVSVTLDASTLAGHAPWSRAAVAFAGRLDQAFAHDPAIVALARERVPRLPVVLAPAVAQVPPSPSPRAIAAVARLLDGDVPARFALGVVWPGDEEQARWYRDAVAPLLHGTPLSLLLGDVSRRQARLIAGAAGADRNLRVYRSRLDANTIGAVARCVDLFVVPAPPRGRCGHDLLVALAASGVPVVAGASVESYVLEHERNAFLVESGDAFGLVSTANQALALPAMQRHQLGESFAAHTLRRWNPAAAVDVYVERFAALVGRPQIPAELRAA